MDAQRKAILPLMLVMVALSAAFFGQAAWLHGRQLDSTIHQNAAEARMALESNLSAARAVCITQLNHLTAHHGDLLGPFQRRRRQELYETALPLFTAMQEEHPGLARMHFHLPDGRSFLRVHRREVFGDDLTDARPMIAEVHQDRTGRDGYEFGTGGLFYRVASPLMHEGQYLGALELGVRPEVLIGDVGETLGVEIAVYTVPKGAYRSSPFDRTERADRQTAVWTNDAGSMLTTLPTVTIEDPASHEIQTSTGRYCVCRAGEIRDYRGDCIGYILIARNTDALNAEHRRFMAVWLLLTVGLIAAAGLVLHLNSGRMIRRIAALNATLERQVGEQEEL